MPGRAGSAWRCLLAVAAGVLGARSLGFAPLVGGRPAARWTHAAREQAHDRVARLAANAEAQDSEGGAILRDVHNLAQVKAGRSLLKGEVQYSYFNVKANPTEWMAQLTLGCFKGSPSCMGEVRKSRVEAKKSAAESFMSDPRFKYLMDSKLDVVKTAADEIRPLKRGKGKAAAEEKAKAEKKSESQKEKKQDKKQEQKPAKKEEKKWEKDVKMEKDKIPKRDAKTKEERQQKKDKRPRGKPLEDQAIGETFTGVVFGQTQAGVMLGARGDLSGVAWLSYSEAYDGVARTPLKDGSTVVARILAKETNDKGLQVTATRRVGSTERPSRKEVGTEDQKLLSKLSVGNWYEGEVLAMLLKAVLFKVPVPGGGWVKGICNMNDFRQGFGGRVSLGDKEKIRIKDIDLKKGLMVASMIDMAEEAYKSAGAAAATAAAPPAHEVPKKAVKPQVWPPQKSEDPLTDMLMGR